MSWDYIMLSLMGYIYVFVVYSMVINHYPDVEMNFRNSAHCAHLVSFFPRVQEQSSYYSVNGEQHWKYMGS